MIDGVLNLVSVKQTSEENWMKKQTDPFSTCNCTRERSSILSSHFMQKCRRTGLLQILSQNPILMGLKQEDGMPVQ
uniref:Uncharacterized protein n=1 Tax=Populus trichocarpa TaxID=3694 RepID=U5G030_POPTR